MRDEYSDRKLRLGMTLRPASRPSPSSATLGIHVATVLNRPELEREHRAQRMARRDHVRSGEAGRFRELLEVERDEPGNKPAPSNYWHQLQKSGAPTW